MKNHCQTLPTSPISFTMIAIEGNMNGDPFKMSDTYQVRLSDFWMGQYPVTQALWAYVMRDTDMVNPSRFQGANRPVENVSWNDIVQDFLPRINKMTGRLYRLPTEAEWEYAARGGKYWKKYSFEYSGGNKLEEVGWYGYDKKSHEETKVVGLKTPNLLGIYDMSGNIWEYCSDWYDLYPSSKNGIIVNPTGPSSGIYRVLRGGTCNGIGVLSSCTFRRNDEGPKFSISGAGFRLVLSSFAVQ